MNSAKKKGAQLLALFLAVVLLLSNLGSVVVLAGAGTSTSITSASGTAEGGSATDCGIASYMATGELSDVHKSDSEQQNAQETDTDLTNTYTTSLVQSAEWTEKDEGEAVINIHYEADLSNETAETRSLYVLTNCDAHGFDIDYAIDNIISLLNFNDYVDVVVIVTQSYIGSVPSCGADYGLFTFALTFSVSADDFESMTDDEERAATLKDILGVSDLDASSGVTSEEALENQEYAYALGGTEGSYASIDVLYNNKDVNAETVSFFLPDSYGQHAGGYFSIYYIDKYIKAIEKRGLNFDTTVQYIINSFDAFAAAVRNTDGDYNTSVLYENIKTYIGLDLTSDSMSLEELNELLADTVQTILSYDTNSRYIVLNPDNIAGSKAYTVNSNLTKGSGYDSISTPNELLYTMFLIDPEGTWGNQEKVIAELEAKLESGTGDTYTTDTLGSYRYDLSIAELGLIDVEWDTKAFTITTTVTSEFDVAKAAKITVTNLSGTNTSFNYTVSTEKYDSDNTVVTIEITNLTKGVNEWTIDVSIPVTLDNTEFRTGDDWFKDTNVTEEKITGETTGAQVSVLSLNNGSSGPYVYEAIESDSPQLYTATVLSSSSGEETTSGSGTSSGTSSSGASSGSGTASGTSGSGTTSTTSDTDGTTTTADSLPETGDTTNPLLPFYAVTASALAVSAIASGFILRRRNRHQGAHFRRI